jgi:hypothetical protein
MNLEDKNKKNLEESVKSNLEEKTQHSLMRFMKRMRMKSTQVTSR